MMDQLIVTCIVTHRVLALEDAVANGWLPVDTVWLRKLDASAACKVCHAGIYQLIR